VPNHRACCERQRIARFNLEFCADRGSVFEEIAGEDLQRNHSRQTGGWRIRLCNDLERRVPSIQENGTHIVGEAGAFDWSGKKFDRRTALWARGKRSASECT
jgi:hypothetical protein